VWQLIGCFDFSCYSISFHFWFPFWAMFVITYPLPEIRREVPRNFWLTKFFARLANAAAS